MLCSSASPIRCIANCQKELHQWGDANQVAFDASKESQHVLSLSDSSDSSFTLLGVPFDSELAMADAISDLVNAAGWKLRTLLRTRRFYADADLVVLYKSHLLSFLEYRTPAVYHATRAVLVRLDSVQTRFLKDIGIDEVTALVEFHLAPLSTRRDIAMLGLLHRTALGKGPSVFQDLFERDQRERSFIDPRRARCAPLIKRSAFGLIAVYNMLPPSIVAAASVSVFQKSLQGIIINYARAGCPKWSEVFSPRLPLSSHPIASLSSVAPALF